MLSAHYQPQGPQKSISVTVEDHYRPQPPPTAEPSAAGAPRAGGFQSPPGPGPGAGWRGGLVAPAAPSGVTMIGAPLPLLRH